MGRRISKLEPVFVNVVPNELEDGRLYIALKYRTVMHKCACGCGGEISTPLHPTGWAIIYDGITVSLSPSVGNWSEHCQSHYWIERNEVHWSRPWTREEIVAGRLQRSEEIREYFDRKESEAERAALPDHHRRGLFSRISGWFVRKFGRRSRRL